jgi:hypothetical protein
VALSLPAGHLMHDLVWPYGHFVIMLICLRDCSRIMCRYDSSSVVSCLPREIVVVALQCVCQFLNVAMSACQYVMV